VSTEPTEWAWSLRIRTLIFSMGGAHYWLLRYSDGPDEDL